MAIPAKVVVNPRASVTWICERCDLRTNGSAASWSGGNTTPKTSSASSSSSPASLSCSSGDF